MSEDILFFMAVIIVSVGTLIALSKDGSIKCLLVPGGTAIGAFLVVFFWLIQPMDVSDPVSVETNSSMILIVSAIFGGACLLFFASRRHKIRINCAKSATCSDADGKNMTACTTCAHYKGAV